MYLRSKGSNKQYPVILWTSTYNYKGYVYTDCQLKFTSSASRERVGANIYSLTFGHILSYIGQPLLGYASRSFNSSYR